MAQELANLPRAYPQPLDPSSRARSPQQDVGENWRYDLESEVALAKALQRYLPFLEALSQATASDVHPRLQHENSPSQGKDPFPESVLTYVAHTAALTYPPMTRDKYPENFPLRTLSRLQPDELSPKVDSNVDRQHLIAALGAYAARRPPLVPKEGDPDPQYLLQNPSRVPRPLLVAAPLQKWPSSPEDPRGPLSSDDDVLIRSLLKDLWQRQAEVTHVGPLELEEMVGTIAGPMQGDEALADKKDGRFHEVSLLSASPGDRGQDHRSPLLPEAPTLEELPKTEAKKPEEPEVSLTWEEEEAGVENVKSHTYSKPLPEKPSSQPRAAGLGLLQAWVPGALQEEQSPRAGARAPPSEGLQLEVEPSEEEDSGYIVTGNDPLNLEKGKQLMGDVAHLLKVPPSIFEDIECWREGVHERSLDTGWHHVGWVLVRSPPHDWEEGGRGPCKKRSGPMEWRHVGARFLSVGLSEVHLLVLVVSLSPAGDSSLVTTQWTQCPGWAWAPVRRGHLLLTDEQDPGWVSACCSVALLLKVSMGRRKGRLQGPRVDSTPGGVRPFWGRCAATGSGGHVPRGFCGLQEFVALSGQSITCIIMEGGWGEATLPVGHCYWNSAGFLRSEKWQVGRPCSGKEVSWAAELTCFCRSGSECRSTAPLDPPTESPCIRSGSGAGPLFPRSQPEHHPAQDLGAWSAAPGQRPPCSLCSRPQLLTVLILILAASKPPPQSPVLAWWSHASLGLVVGPVYTGSFALWNIRALPECPENPLGPVVMDALGRGSGPGCASRASWRKSSSTLGAWCCL
ncbi:Hypothetical predicted protein [Marmota monax]|uniref:Protein-tyrosine phosphatase receptor IA-2 ectodomain domain-containing protein n=1 Tax=Marmota monax TaxID=9995 RepID=A0A5E4C325_MARMO|nr:hypothetical protein GHT09_015384 [Marmota monax]VTJ76293.1 Hypothetical predicted protein [Marmota monax]